MLILNIWYVTMLTETVTMLDVNKVVGYDELRQPETPCCVKENA